MNDDEAGRRLTNAIPEPRAGYWGTIHDALGRIEADEDFDEMLDTARDELRLTDMTNTNPPTNSPKPQRNVVFAMAAALLLIVGLGAVALTYRGNNDDISEVDVAGQPDGDGAPTTPPTNDGSGDADPPATAVAGQPVNVTGVVFGDAASPVGGTVKKATLSGPETSVMVACDQGGFEPFVFTDQGRWVGCQLPAGATAGAESALTEAVFTEVASPVGGLVGQIIVPGPQESVTIECEGDFTPFLFTDQGTWIGCQSAVPGNSAPTPAATTAPSGTVGVLITDAVSPVGGTVKKATLSGPETSMMVLCDQAGFEPFVFTDQGTWVGCQLSAGATAGAESAFTEPVFTKVASPVGGLVAQLLVPGPQESVIIECRGDFTPFLFTDQGTWIGCRS